MSQATAEPSTCSIPITFRYNGQETIIKTLGRKFETSLTQLLREANVAGSFVVTCATKVKGRPHMQGLTIGSPNGKHRSVEVCWQEGGNDGRYSMLLSCPHGMDPMEFHSRLKAAEAALDAAETDSDTSRDLPPIHVEEDHTGRGVVTSINFGKPEKTPESGQPANVVGPKDDFAQAAEKAQKSIIRFADNESAVELFVEECLKYSDVDGRVLRAVCWKVLKESFQYTRTGSICEALVTRGHLVVLDGDKDRYQIPEAWLKRFRPSAASERIPAASTTKSETAPGISKPVVEKTSPSGEPTPRSKSLADDIAELAKKAQTAAKLRKSLEEIKVELVHVDSLRQGILARQAKIEAMLQRPDLLDAEEKLAVIQKTLSGA